MYSPVIVLFLLGLFILAVVRAWIIWRGLKGKFPGRFIATLGLQLWGLALVWPVLTGSFGWALTALVPEVQFLALVNLYAEFWPFVAPSLLFASIAAGTVALLLLLGRFPALAVSGALLVFGVATVVLSERHSQRIICESAQARGLDILNRNSILWSAQNVDQFVVPQEHAIARRGDVAYGWSYAQLDWYELPDQSRGRWEYEGYDCTD